MQAVKRSAARASQTTRSYSRQQRRWAHDAHHDSHAHAGPIPANETFGRGFWIGVSALPLTFAVFQFSGPGSFEHSYWTRVIDSYDHWRATWADRNDLHTRALEQAAHDKNLFINSSSSRHVELKFPEVLNTGAPWNVPAGSRANVDHAIAKYEKENFAENEKKLQQLRDNDVPAEKPYTGIITNRPDTL
ncbi:hypothetical protein BDV97DRAFT_299932 [Delphinella strobiligena]|nr:hypothetical protein BDV97DRAFT_299932 [Delphinella strobiligena]